MFQEFVTKKLRQWSGMFFRWTSDEVSSDGRRPRPGHDCWTWTTHTHTHTGSGEVTGEEKATNHRQSFQHQWSWEPAAGSHDADAVVWSSSPWAGAKEGQTHTHTNTHTVPPEPQTWQQLVCDGGGPKSGLGTQKVAEHWKSGWFSCRFSHRPWSQTWLETRSVFTLNWPEVWMRVWTEEISRFFLSIVANVFQE